jgi:hypothetical protein
MIHVPDVGPPSAARHTAAPERALWDCLIWAALGTTAWFTMLVRPAGSSVDVQSEGWHWEALWRT